MPRSARIPQDALIADIKVEREHSWLDGSDLSFLIHRIYLYFTFWTQDNEAGQNPRSSAEWAMDRPNVLS